MKWPELFKVAAGLRPIKEKQARLCRAGTRRNQQEKTGCQPKRY